MNLRELIELEQKTGQPFHEVILLTQMMEDGSDPIDLRKKMKVFLETMLDIAEKNFAKSQKTLMGLCGENASVFAQHLPQMMGEFNHMTTIVALSIAEANASMGKIVACPTAGACGVVPAMAYALRKLKGVSEESLVDGLIVAGAVGACIAEHASISGAVAGCQAEIGTATAMASSLAVYCLSKNSDKVSHAAALSLKSLMGLVCDPVGGFVEIPCVKRNAVAVNIAIATAEMALAGIQSVIPFDEVVQAMAKVGKSLPEELRETGLGGVASTKTAASLLEKIRGELM